MTNEIMNSTGNLPGFVKQRQSALVDSMGGGLADSTPSISLRGSRFRFNKDGVESKPYESPHLDVIVVGASAHIQRAYFDKAYDPKTDTKPVCTSHDGMTPNPRSSSPQNAACQFCPQNTKQPDPRRPGNDWTPCGFSKDIAVMIPGDTTHTVWRIKLSSMSVFNTDLRDNGTMGWKALVNHFKAMGADALNYVVRITFDTDASVPALLFQISSTVGDGTNAYDEAFYNAVIEAVDGGVPERVVGDANITSQPVGTVENQSNQPAPIPVQGTGAAAPQQAASQPAAPAQATAPTAPAPAPAPAPTAPALVTPNQQVESVAEQAMDASGDDVAELLAMFK